ncbi:MAG TPA: Dyp-type peroxidase, partial [Candidatus Corynebacterium gallistercoris]|nr:Dyp-type peroxidase [Candidatus Corynebacterium gallistercoris]
MVDAHDQQRSVGISRRGFFAGVGAAGVAGALAACAADSEPSTGARRPAEAEVASPHKEGQLDTVTFDGPHQAGIATPHQAHAVVIAYNFAGAEANRTNMRRLMTIWTGDARAMTSGGAALADLEAELGASPANLTITVGWGPRLIDALKLTGDVPHWCRNNLHGLPAFEGDQLDPAWGEADLCLQICGDDLTTVSHAARVLTRGGQDYVRPVWSQRGFVNVRDGETPRNLLGFKDGTAIPRTEEEYDAAVWDDLGGSAMVVRRVVY